MSIPIRLWRALRGRILMARERASVSQAELEAALERAAIAQAEADAARELAEHGQGGSGGRHVGGPASPRVPPLPPRPAGGTADPFAEDYALLQLAPGAGLAALEVAYQARLAETRTDQQPEGSPERARAEARRRAIDAAYERLRDALNTTETRFEKLEF
jgi:hypothetical protein